MNRLDLLAMQLMQALQFISSGFNKEMFFTDHVMLETLSSDEMFYKDGRYWFMRNDSLPGDPVLKAIAFDKDNIYLETSDIDTKLAAEIIEDWKLDCKINSESRSVFSADGVKVLEYGAPVTPKVEGEPIEPRIKITIPLQGTNLQGVKLADALWSGGAFVSAEEAEIETETGPQKIELKLNLNLRLQLKLEQRPMLLLNTGVGVVQRGDLQLKGILAMQTRLLKMSDEELEGAVLEMSATHGEKATVRALDFILAGKVKRVAPHLTWREARQVAKKAASKITA